MTATVAELQGDAREGRAERSSRQTCGRRNTNSQRGLTRAVSVRGNAKPRGHQDAEGRGWRHAGKVHVLTQGDLVCESGQGVSRSHSNPTEPGAREGSSNCHRNALGGEGLKEPESQALESIGPESKKQEGPTSARGPARSRLLGTNRGWPMRCSRVKPTRDRTRPEPA